MMNRIKARYVRDVAHIEFLPHYDFRVCSTGHESLRNQVAQVDSLAFAGHVPSFFLGAIQTLI